MNEKKIYQVFCSDIWNTNSLIGFFSDLDDAVDGINEMIMDERWKVKKGDIREKAGTFEPYFDVTLRDIVGSRDASAWEADDEDLDMMIRGFIFDGEQLIEEVTRVMEKGDMMGGEEDESRG